MNAQTDTKTVEEIMEISAAESKGALEVRVDNSSIEDQARVKKLMSEIDMTNSMSIVSFGVDTQRGLSEQSNNMLAGVRNKDTGPAGEVMNGLMVQIRGLGLDSLDPNEKPNWLTKIWSKVTPVQKFIQQFESIESQIDATINKLEGEQRKLSRDILMLDGMYDEGLKFFNELAYYIDAGEMKLEEVRTVDVPALQDDVDALDPSDSKTMIRQNEVKDLTDRAMDLERKIHDLMLTRTVTMQMLPQLRMIQDTDKALVTKMQTAVLTTIPVWKNQIAMSIAIWNQTEAAKTTKAVADATSEMIIRASEQLKTSNAISRTEIERGVVDIEAIKIANKNLIDTIVESVQIAEAGQAARIAAKADMANCEVELTKALKSASHLAV